MAFKLTAPIVKEYDLVKTDKHYESEGTWVKIRQATQKENEERARKFSQIVRKIEIDELGNEQISVVQDFCVPELMRIEARLTLVESNIEDEKGKPLFKERMPAAAFDRAWGLLAPIVAYEIHDKVLEANPTWAPAGE